MAKNLVLDLGINLDAQKLSGFALMTTEEIELRRLIYWSIYSDDKFFTAYMGRVCTLLNMQGLVALLLAPVGSTADNCGNDSLHLLCPSIVFLQHALARLARILEDILLSLYAPQPKCTGSARQEFFDSCSLKLKAWTYDLKQELRFERLGLSSLPQAFTMHMVYHTIWILLARPFLSQAVSKHATTEATYQNSARSFISESERISNVSARQICKIARKYRQIYRSFRRSPITATHCTLSAALVFLRNGSDPSSSSAKSVKEDIALCLDVLNELSISWETARRIRSNLLALLGTSRSPNHCDAMAETTRHTGQSAVLPSGTAQSLTTGTTSQDQLLDSETTMTTAWHDQSLTSPTLDSWSYIEDIDYELWDGFGLENILRSTMGEGFLSDTVFQ